VRRNWHCGLLALLILAVPVGGCGDSEPSNAPSTSKNEKKQVAQAQKKNRKKPKRKPRQTRRKDRKASLVDLLPANTTLAIHFPNLKRTRERLKNTTLADILRDPDVQKLLSVPAEAVVRGVKRLKLEMGVDVQAILNELDGEAVLGVTLNGLEPGFLGAIELGDAYLATHRLVRELGKGKLKFEHQADVDVFSLRLGRVGGRGTGPEEMKICFHRGRLLVAAGEGMLEMAVNGPTTPLSSSKNYQQCVAQTFGSEAAVRCYLNLEPLVRLAMFAGGEEAGQALSILGLDHARSLTMATTIDGAEFRDRVVFLCENGNPLLERLLVNHQVSRETLGRVPGSVASFMLGRVRLAWLPGFVTELAAKADEAAAGKVERALAEAKGLLGCSLEEFLEALGDEVLYLKTKTPENLPLQAKLSDPLLGSILAFRMRDEKKVAAGLESLSRLPVGLRPATIRSLSGYEWRINRDLPIRPHIVLHDGWLYMTTDPETLLQFLESEGVTSILKSPTFELRFRTMPEKVCGVSYTDLRPTVRQLFQMVQEALPMLSMAMDGQANLPFDKSNLPNPDAINHYLTPVTSHVQLIKNGLVSETVSPIGSITMVLPAAAAAVMIPNMVASQRPRGDERSPFRGGPGLLKLLRGLKKSPSPRTPGPGPLGSSDRPDRPNRRTGVDPSRNETGALYALRSLVEAQEMFKRTTAVDANQNRIGEFATLAELAGTAPVRYTGSPLDPPILTSSFGQIERGVLKRSGYCFRLYLPGPQGKPIAESESGGASTGIDASLAERSWCVFAWPQSSLTGKRSFYADQRGRVYETNYPYRGSKAPDPTILMRKKDDITSGLKENGVGEDGSRWAPVR